MRDRIVSTNGQPDKVKLGRRCTVCTHPDASTIHKAIADGATFRSIERQFGMHNSSVSRHVENCLDLDLRSVVETQAAKLKINVYEEFADQLAFAKELKQAARNYLSDANDPLRLDLTPRATEIEVTYLDHNDMEEISFGNKVIERPKKKKAMLSAILESMKDADLHPEKFTIKTIDIRKFALEAINTADICIDKFARMGGAYKSAGPGEADVADLIEGLIDRLASLGWEREAARQFAQKRYGNGQPLRLKA